MKKRVLSTLTTVLFLSACGGSSDPSNTNETVQPPPPSLTVSDIDGIYEGAFAANGQSIEIAGLISGDGDAVFLSEVGELLFGKITLDGETVTVDPLRSYFTEGASDDFVVGGLFNESGILNADFDNGQLTGTSEFSNTTSEFTLTRNDAETGIGAELSALEGNYVTGDFLTSLSFDADGIISGSDSDGCVYNGETMVLDTSVNIYTLSIEVSNCDVANGTYTGLGALYQQGLEGISEDPVFIFGISSNLAAISSYLLQN